MEFAKAIRASLLAGTLFQRSEPLDGFGGDRRANAAASSGHPAARAAFDRSRRFRENPISGRHRSSARSFTLGPTAAALVQLSLVRGTPRPGSSSVGNHDSAQIGSLGGISCRTVFEGSVKQGSSGPRSSMNSGGSRMRVLLTGVGCVGRDVSPVIAVTLEMGLGWIWLDTADPPRKDGRTWETEAWT